MKMIPSLDRLNVDINLVHTSCFWNNIQHVRLIVKIGKPKIQWTKNRKYVQVVCYCLGFLLTFTKNFFLLEPVFKTHVNMHFPE